MYYMCQCSVKSGDFQDSVHTGLGNSSQRISVQYAKPTEGNISLC